MDRSEADDVTVEGASAEDAATEDATGGSAVGEPVLRPAVTDAAAAATTAADVRLEGERRATRPDRVSSVLVAVGEGPHAGATVDVAREVADATDAWLELFHVVPSEAAIAAETATDEGRTDADDRGPAEGGGVRDSAGDDADGGRSDGDRLLAAAEDRLGAFDRVDRWLVEDRTAADAIVEQSPYYDLVVVGAPTTGTVGRFVFGSTTDTVVDEAAVPVIVVEANGSTALRGE
ncbi:universal stress protein [Halorubrum sp. CBA1125]|uniref:universal stress protein n=1 Tax=Halorubrum sp. CBA1125 TaxID=2668072 RepID=UPI0012E8E464|nr:universal stress protein [Halorubrum sp. CBA1125]MUW15060.1 universal stress protein [Halorubrum sp. CBA1125]